MLKKSFLLFRILTVCLALWSFVHPYYVSVTDIHVDEKKGEIQISIKMFTDNLEEAIGKLYGSKTDLKNAKDQVRTNAEWTLERYLKRNFLLKLNGEEITLNFEGYETDAEATWCYLSTKIETPVNKAEISNSLLFDFLPEQMNIVHFSNKGDKKSDKVNNPEKKIVFDWK